MWIKARDCESAHCVELSCDSGACVELSPEEGHIRIRATALGEPDTHIKVTRDELAVFFKAVKAGEFDHLAQPAQP